MSFLSIPRNYAPGFAPQHYLYVNDRAVEELTALLSDTRSGEQIASLALRNRWNPDVEVSAFLRRMAQPTPFDDGQTGLHAPEQRTMTLSMTIAGEAAIDRIFFPATSTTANGEALTLLPAVRLLGADEADEISIHCQSNASATLVVTTQTGSETHQYEATAAGVVLFRLDAAAFPDASAFDLTITVGDRQSVFHYEIVPSFGSGRRVAWLNEKGGIDRYTFPMVEQRRYDIERKRCYLAESGYTQSEASFEEHLSLGSAYEPVAVLDALARIASAPAVWIAGDDGWTPVDVVTDTLRIERSGKLQYLELEIRPRQKGVRL